MKTARFSCRDRRSMLVLILAAMALLVHGEDQGPVPTPAPMDVTEVPETPPPTTTPEPTTLAPTEPEPTTPPPTAPEPTTPPPTTLPPTTPEPTTPEPMTPEPTTAPPVQTTAPTVSPTTIPPTTVPPETVVPTTTPPVPTEAPTVTPTGAPTEGPTTGPTSSPTPAGNPVSPKKFPNLSMTLTGVDSLTNDSWDTFGSEYLDFNRQFYAANPQFGVSNIDTLLELVSPSLSRRLGEAPRQLQDTLTLVYNQAITYTIASGSRLQPADVVTQPFASQTSRDAFAASLRGSGDPAFANIDSVSGVSQSQPASDDDGLSTGAIIGIAVGGAAGAALLVGGGYWLFTRDKSGGYAKDVGDQPPSSLKLGGGDDISTLQDPTRPYGDQSVATVDYDYSKAYGGGGDTSVVSSVGGTLGSQTAATRSGAGAVDASFSDEASFDAHYQDPNATVKEVALDIWAPPGKLGVVIDTPNDGAPVVHAIKDSSPIADKLQVGDKLIAVDDENVETMTAIKVSKLISRKSANSTRKLSIIRTVVDD